MKIDPRAGQLAIASDLVDVPKLITAYYEERPDPDFPEQLAAEITAICKKDPGELSAKLGDSLYRRS
jgi:hypothetical protein